MGKLRDRVIAEQRVYDDPKHPDTSDYDVAFLKTVTSAVIDPKTGEKLDATVARIGKAANDALAAANAAQKTADNALTTANLAKEVAEGAAEAIAAVQNTISATPSQSGSLVYTGAAQKPTWNNYPVEMLVITYGDARVAEGAFTGEINAGTYKAYATPKEGYTWGDKSATERELTWTIQRATIANIPSVKTPLAYTGSAQAPEWLNLNTAQLTKTETAQTNAGDYSSSFTPTANFQWPDGTTAAKTVSWNIARAVLAVPTQSGNLTYTGNAQSPTLTGYDANKMTLGGDTSKTDSGSYSATVTPKANYQWPDGATSAKSVPWSIGKAAGSLSISPTTVALTGAGDTSVIAVTRAGNGAISATSSNTGVATVSISGDYVVVTGKGEGSATITVKVAEGSNHLAPSNKTASVSVTKPTVANSTWDNIKAISDAGNAASYFAVGDKKTIKLNGTVGTLSLSNLSVDVFIIGINHNSAKEGSNRIHWLIGKISNADVALCDSGYGSGYTNGTKYFNMSHWGNYNYGGWKGSDMRYDILGSTNKQPSGYGSAPATSKVGYDPSNYDIVNSPVANTLMAALPSDLRAVMKTVTKYTDNVGNANNNTASAVTASIDYLFLLAEFEVFGTRSYANSYEQNYQAQYDYFKAGNSKVAYKHNATTTAVWWWLRSAYYDGNFSFGVVGTGGGIGTNNANYAGAVRAGFSV